MVQEHSLWPGWETVKPIGKGGFGSVYEIRRNLFGSTEFAALKVITIPQNEGELDELRADGHDHASIERTYTQYMQSIIGEYTIMRKLNACPNIVLCDDVRYERHPDGIGWDIFIKMELLTPILKAFPGPISEQLVLKAGKDLCNALVMCKQFNVLHRDIKPQNIFISNTGDFKLGDFGIAKASAHTMGGTKIGTYKYMAPEVYNNQPYGSAADIYSLGLVLYWMLNEHRLPFLPMPPVMPTFSDEEQAKLRRFRGEPIPAPKNGSEALKAVVLKACAFQPADRFHSAAEMLKALEQVANTPAPAPAAQERGPQDETVRIRPVPQENLRPIPQPEPKPAPQPVARPVPQPASPSQPAKTKKRNWFIGITALLVAAAILLVILLPLNQDTSSTSDEHSSSGTKTGLDKNTGEENQQQAESTVGGDTTRYGGHINVRSTARPTGIDPLKQTGAWKYQWTTCVYEPFLSRDPQDNIKAAVCNFVLEDYYDESGQRHTELWIWPREGYTFSHGYGQVDMDDIVASFNRGLAQYANIKKFVKPNIDTTTNKVYRVSALDAEIQEQIKATAAADTAGNGQQVVNEVFHINFKYHEKNLYYLAAWRTWWPVMPKEICEEYATKYIMNQLEDGVGTGPYVFSEFKDSTYVTLKKRDDYIPVEQPADNTGMTVTKYGYLDSMTFWYNSSDDNAATCVLAGEYDVTDVISTDYQSMAESSGITVTKMASDQRCWIYFNTMGTNNIVAKYPSLRKAVMAAIDYPTYLEFVTDDSQIMDTDQIMLGGENGIYNFVTEKFKAADYYGEYDQAVVDKYMAMARQEGYKGEALQIAHSTGRTDIPTITAATMERAGINYELVPNEASVHAAFIGDPSNNWDFYFAWGVTYHTPGTMADSLVKNNFKSDRVLEIREELMPKLDPTSDEYLALWDEWTDIWVEECQLGYLGAVDWWWWHPEDLVINDGGEYDGTTTSLCEQRNFFNTYWKYPDEHPKK